MSFDKILTSAIIFAEYPSNVECDVMQQGMDSQAHGLHHTIPGTLR
jgi:hypothetical protein